METLFFSVTGPDGTRLAGEAGLALKPAAGQLGHRFDDIEFRGKALRAVTLHRDLPVPFDIVVAETQVGRAALLRLLLLYSLAPQAVLLGLVAWWVTRLVRADLRPLAQLQQAVDNRDANDLAPVEVPATTRDTVRLAGAINSLLQRLERSVRAQREFAGNVAHELRTPLAGIRALAEYGLAQKDPASWREQLERIASSQARASRMVDQLLDLAVAHEAEAGLKLGMVRLDEAVREAVLRFLPAADAAGVDLGALGIDGPSQVLGDPMLIDGILNNLLDNALRYGTDGAHGAADGDGGDRAGRGRYRVVGAGQRLGPARRNAEETDAARRAGRSRPAAGGGRGTGARAGRAVRAADGRAHEPGQRARTAPAGSAASLSRADPRRR